MKTVAILILIGVISIAVFGLTAGQTAVNRYYDHQEQPISAAAMVMQSRETPPVAPTGRTAAILFPLALVLLALFVIGALFYGERLLKQYRLLTKKNRRSRFAPSLPPYQPQSEWHDTPQVPGVRQIPSPQENPYDA